MKLIVGLGNPGYQYANTRHNVGFWFVDRFLELNKSSAINEIKCNSIINQYVKNSKKIILSKPQTFMNLSGNGILSIMNFYKINIEDVLVVHDELDLSIGKIKLKQGGGDNGHNGLKNITQIIGPNYWRLRCGIGRPIDNDNISNYVLSVPKKEEYNLIIGAIDKSLNVIDEIIDGQINTAMKQLHT